VHLTALSKDTELADTILASSPRVLRIIAGLLLLILVIAGVWAYIAHIDLVVKSPSRVRSATSPLNDFNASSGDELSLPIAGQVAVVSVKEGDAVEKGALILQLDTKRIDNDIDRVRKQVASNRDEMRRSAELLAETDRQQQQAVAKAQANIEEAKQGLKAERERYEREEQHRCAEEKLLAIDVAKQSENLDRLNRLLKDGVVPRTDITAAEFALKVAHGQLEKAQIPLPDSGVKVAERHVATAETELQLVTHQYAVNRHELEVQQARRAAEVDSLEQSIANLELDRDRCRVRSPIDGTVSTLKVQVGQVVQAGQPVAFVVDQSGYRIDALVSSADIGQIKPGMSARVKLDAFDYQRFGTLDATVTHVGNDSALTDTGAFYIVRMSVRDSHLRDGTAIKLGMTGTAEIMVDSERLLWLMFNQAEKKLGVW
jgi:HlyD family type I secretion membrane fusion protein